jgi:hypothetical protein
VEGTRTKTTLAFQYQQALCKYFTCLSVYVSIFPSIHPSIDLISSPLQAYREGLSILLSRRENEVQRG